MISRLPPAALALACAALAVWLGWHHPVSPAVMLLACGLLAGLVFVQFRWWPVFLLPLLPLASLMPWTGWITVEEWDLLVLSAASGGYARLAVDPRDADGAPRSHTLAPWLLLLPYALLTLVSMERGIADAGGLQWGWWQGYREPLNSLRQAKPVLLVLLLLPLWLALDRRLGERAAGVMTTALVLMAAAVALPVWWERLAFTGLANFSTDYRATGLFWEMHVGGAALDASLALTMPFVLVALLAARGARGWLLAAVVAGLASYAALVTFSRIVYLAVPVALVMAWWLARRQRQARFEALPVLAMVVVIAVCAAGAWWIFPSAGYRGMLALLVAVSLTLLSDAELRRLPPRLRVVAAVLGLPALALVAALSVGFAKGAYVAAGLLSLATLALLLAGRLYRSPALTALAGGCLIGVAGCVVAVGWHWGGAEGLGRTLWPAGALLGVLGVALFSDRPLWPQAPQWQAQAILSMACVMAVVGVFSGGAYMGDRLKSASQDVVDRRSHWGSLLGLLRSAEQSALGYGLGRTPAQLALSGQTEMRTGDYRLLDGPEGPAVVLTSGSHMQGWGELFRLSQRIQPVGPAPLTVKMRVRPLTPLAVHAEVCAKHLIYNGTCRTANRRLTTGLGEWQSVELPLAGEAVGGHGWPPQLVVFSVAVDAIGGRLEIDEVSLVDAQGQQLLDNGGFTQGLRRWFFSSDRHHMPWHAKNLAVHLWFEQGWLSLALLGGATLLALGRATWGRARGHPLAPATSAALVGLVIVGLVDSVFDMPRISFLTLWVLALALSLDNGRTSAPLPGRA